jgi:hypothetical protein
MFDVPGRLCRETFGFPNLSRLRGAIASNDVTGHIREYSPGNVSSQIGRLSRLAGRAGNAMAVTASRYVPITPKGPDTLATQILQNPSSRPSRPDSYVKAPALTFYIML